MLRLIQSAILPLVRPTIDVATTMGVAIASATTGILTGVSVDQRAALDNTTHVPIGWLFALIGCLAGFGLVLLKVAMMFQEIRDNLKTNTATTQEVKGDLEIVKGDIKQIQISGCAHGCGSRGHRGQQE